jgi:capsid protein
MDDFYEQCVCVKFSFILEKTFLETFRMLKQVFGVESMSRTQTHEWYKCFQEGRTSIEDSERSGQPSASKYDENIQQVQKVIHSNCHLTIHEVAEEAGISKSRVI